MAVQEGTIRILLACGIGASTGFMAANMRKMAKKKGLNVSVHAVSKSEVMEFADKIDVLLLGPHFSGEVSEYQEKLGPYGVVVSSINPKYYGSLDAEHILEDAVKLYGQRGA